MFKVLQLFPLKLSLKVCSTRREVQCVWSDQKNFKHVAKLLHLFKTGTQSSESLVHYHDKVVCFICLLWVLGIFIQIFIPFAFQLSCCFDYRFNVHIRSNLFCSGFCRHKAGVCIFCMKSVTLFNCDKATSSCMALDWSLLLTVFTPNRMIPYDHRHYEFKAFHFISEGLGFTFNFGVTTVLCHFKQNIPNVTCLIAYCFYTLYQTFSPCFRERYNSADSEYFPPFRRACEHCIKICCHIYWC